MYSFLSNVYIAGSLFLFLSSPLYNALETDSSSLQAQYHSPNQNSSSPRDHSFNKTSSSSQSYDVNLQPNLRINLTTNSISSYPEYHSLLNVKNESIALTNNSTKMPIQNNSYYRYNIQDDDRDRRKNPKKDVLTLQQLEYVKKDTNSGRKSENVAKVYVNPSSLTKNQSGMDSTRDRTLGAEKTTNRKNNSKLSNFVDPKRPYRQTRRQVTRQRPGFFWTLGRVIFETFNDTRSAVQQISNLIGENVVPDPPPTRRPITSGSLVATTAIAPASVSVRTNENVTTTTTTTTPAPFVLTRSGLQSIVRRNLMGLVRLFNIEWRDAINDSQNSIRDFRKDLGKQIGLYLRDDPNVF